MLGFLSLIGSLIGGELASWQKRREVKLEADVKLTQARAEAEITRVQKAQDADREWERIMAEGSRVSWADEWFTILLSIPLIMCFVPGLADYAKAGFLALSESVPDWYLYSLSVAIAAAFGVRNVIGVLKKK